MLMGMIQERAVNFWRDDLEQVSDDGIQGQSIIRKKSRQKVWGSAVAGK